MFRKLTLIFTLCFIWTGNIVSAETVTTKFPKAQEISSSDISTTGDCPSLNVLRKNSVWVEHTGKWSKFLNGVLMKHFSLPIAPKKPSVSLTLLPVNVDRGMGITGWREIVWVVHRTNQMNFIGKNNNCFVLGSVAYYAEVKNKNGWPPEVKLISEPETEEKCLQKGDTGLIELRWYDPVEKKKHRWFNRRLASFLQWTDEYKYSPIPLPRVINSLD